MDSVLVVLNVILNIALGLIVAWLLITNVQSRMWRAVLSVIEAGVMTNLAGLVWLDYQDVWPGEPLLTVGFFAFVLVLVLGGRPPVIRPLKRWPQ